MADKESKTEQGSSREGAQRAEFKTKSGGVTEEKPVKKSKTSKEE